VVIIYDKGVCVVHRLMTVWMAMGFGSFPTFVVMIVMEIVGVFVLVEFLRVGVK
jgi:hypothetical protein